MNVRPSVQALGTFVNELIEGRRVEIGGSGHASTLLSRSSSQQPGIPTSNLPSVRPPSCRVEARKVSGPWSVSCYDIPGYNRGERPREEDEEPVSI